MKKLCVSIPEELRCYQKVPQNYSAQKNEFRSNIAIIKDSCGKIERVDYYAPQGDLLKRVVYNGSNIIGIYNYRNGELYISEEYKDNLVVSKKVFGKSEKIVSQIYYEYNRENQITGIRKIQDCSQYRVQYGYDQLGRVSKRKIWLNTNVVEEQNYKYDIFDRIVEYQDLNQTIKVNKVSENNELVSYTITDTAGNEISVFNHIVDSQYLKTELLLNGHSMTIKDKNYLDNIMLKKPYISEDDLDLVMHHLFRTESEQSQNITKRSANNDVNNDVINNNIKKISQPISVNKNFCQITKSQHCFTKV